MEIDTTVLGQDWRYDLSCDIGESEVATFESIGQPFVIDSHQMQNRGLEIVWVDTVFDDVVGKVVCFAVGHTPANSATR